MRRYAGVLLGLGALSGLGEADPTLNWMATKDFGGDNDGPTLVVPDGAGGAFVLGATPQYTGDEDIFIIRYDAAGNELWTTMYDGPGGVYDVPVEATVDASGDLYVTAESATAFGSPVGVEWATLKYSPAGDLLWERRFHGDGTFGQSRPRDMALRPGGGVVVTGWALSDTSWLDYGVVSYDPNGHTAWVRQFSSPGYHADAAEALAVGTDGRVAVTGQYVEDGGRILGTVVFDAAGVEQWSATFDASAVSDLEDRTYSVAIAADGSVYVAGDGIDDFNSGRDFVLLKYDAAGGLVWSRRLVTPTADFWPILVLAADGTIVLSGSSDAGHRLAAYAPDGTPLWTLRRDGAIATDGRSDHVTLDADGHIAVLLRTVPTPGITAFTLRRYDLAGTLVDQVTLDPAGVSRFPTGLASDPSGVLYAVGWWKPQQLNDALLYQLALPAEPVRGDIDGDGCVTLSDLLLVLANFGTGAGGDADGDADTDLDDLLVVLTEFGC